MNQLWREVLELLQGERLAEGQRRLSDAYHLRALDQPAVVQFNWSEYRPFTSREMAADPAKNLEQRLALTKGGLLVGTDFAPTVDMSEPFGTVMVADAFGCPIQWRGGEPPWADPAITSARHIAQVKKPKLNEARMIQEIRRHVEYATRATRGELPMLLIDLQSPYSIACQIWETEDLMMACYTDPDAVHTFLKVITEFSIEFLTEYMTWIERPMYPGRNFPSIEEDIGINIADDTSAIMLSPAQYGEFALPYNVQIAEAFNGISIHCCGDYNHQIDNLLKLPGLKAIQCHVGPGEMHAQPMVSKINGKCALWCDWNDVAKATYPDAKTLQEDYVLPEVSKIDRGLIMQGPGGATIEEIRENYQWCLEQLQDTAAHVPEPTSPLR